LKVKFGRVQKIHILIFFSVFFQNAVRVGYGNGEKKGYQWHFAGKRYIFNFNSLYI